MMSKNFWNFEKFKKFILSHSKKNRAFSEVCKDMIGDVMRLYCISSWGTLIIQRKSVRACVPTVAKVVGFPCSRFPYPLIFKAIFDFFESEFLSVMDRAAICIRGNWLGIFACICNNAENGRTWQT